MGRVYSVNFDATAATAAVDFFEIAPADDKPCAIHSIVIGQTTETGDAMEEMLEVEIHRGGTAMTTGSGGGTAVVNSLASSATATAGFAAEVMNTTAATFTSGVVVYRDSFNVRTGWQYFPLPEDRIGVSQVNGGLVVRLGSAPVDTITWVGTMTLEELI